MATVSVNLDKARRLLEKAWAAVDDSSIIPPEPVATLLQTIVASQDATFKYILVTGVSGQMREQENPSKGLASEQQAQTRLRRAKSLS